MDRYSQSWSWKITGPLAMDAVSRMVTQSWCGDGPDEVIIPDNAESVESIKQMLERYPLEIISKSAWRRKITAGKPRQPRRFEELRKAKPGEQFRGTLLDFQKEGLDFLLKSSGNALLADEMGLGKTVQTLAYLASEAGAMPALVVAPLVTLQNWQREIQKFIKKKSRNGRIIEDEYPSSVLIRNGRIADIPKSDFYIINYELLDKRLGDLARLNAKTLICDEVQNLRSKSTKKYAAVKKLAALKSIRYRIGLSGTPIYNSGSEIWPIVDVIKPGLLGSFAEFCEYFCYINERGKAIVLEKKRKSLRDELQKYVMLRRRKSDVLKELKEKVRYKEFIDADNEYYTKELAKIWKKLESDQLKAENNFDRLASLQRAMQGERQAAGAAKIPHVTSFVRGMMEIEESVVVFCHHRSIHKILHESLHGFSPASIIGGQSDAVRQTEIDRFQGGETKLMIAGLRAGNVGINLNRARYVIFAELDWSPAIHHQAEDRLHRIGQKDTVFSYYLIGNGTLDDHVAEILVDKSNEIDDIMDGSSGVELQNVEKAEIIMAQIRKRLDGGESTHADT